MTKILFCTLCFIYFPLASYSQDEWTFYKTQDAVSLWIKDVPGSKLSQFKLETTVRSNLASFYRILHDVENMSAWYDKVKSVRLLKKLSDTEAIYLLEYNLPFPFENRVSTVKGSMIFDRQSNLVRIITEYYPYEIPESFQGKPVINIIKSYWEVTDNKNGTIKIIHSGYMDPGGNIPVWLTNEGVTSTPFKTIRNLKKLLKA